MTPRLLAAAALLCACTASGAHRAAPPPADARAALPLHHDLKVTLEPGARRISVEDTITLSPELRARPGDAVELIAPRRPLPGARRRRPPLARVEAGAARAGEPRAHRALRGEARAVGAGLHRALRRGALPPRPRGRRGGAEGRREPRDRLRRGRGALRRERVGARPRRRRSSRSRSRRACPPAGTPSRRARRARHERGERETLVRWESPEPQEEVFLVAAPFVERSRDGGRFVVQTFLRADDAALAADVPRRRRALPRDSTTRSSGRTRTRSSRWSRTSGRPATGCRRSRCSARR